MSLKVFKWPGSKQPHLSKLLPLIPQGGVYDKLVEHGWHKTQFTTITQMNNVKGEGQRKLKLQRAECVWRNSQAVAATANNPSLFD